MLSPSISAWKPAQTWLVKSSAPAAPFGRTQTRGQGRRALRIQGLMAEKSACQGGLLAVDNLTRELLPATRLVSVCV